jgi:hypothetical protein
MDKDKLMCWTCNPNSCPFSCSEWNPALDLGSFFYRRLEDVVVEILQDPRTTGKINWSAKPLFTGGKRVVGPFSSGLHMQMQELKHPGKTVIHVIAYSDETEFFKGESAHPVFGNVAVQRTLACEGPLTAPPAPCALSGTLGNLHEEIRCVNLLLA